MNFMVFTSHFANLYFTSTILQYPCSFSAEMDSTHFKDFRDTLFVIFGQVLYFISILQVAAEIWNLKFEFKLDLTHLTRELTRLVDVA
jgi:hypothetical protein